MVFFIKRYIHKVAMVRIWFLVAFIPPVFYLSTKAVIPDMYTVFQDVSISLNAPVALTTSPTDFETLQWFSKHQDEFFLDIFTIRALHNQLNPRVVIDQKISQDNGLMDIIKNSMSIKIIKENIARVVYVGSDKQLGQSFVDFYAKRLVKKAEEGIKRKKIESQNQTMQESSLNKQPFSPQNAQKIDAVGGVVLTEQKALWRQDRLLPCVILFFISCLILLITIVFIELFDSSFKSERQVAAYLKLPILGTLPNLSKMSKSMGI